MRKYLELYPEIDLSEKLKDFCLAINNIIYDGDNEIAVAISNKYPLLDMNKDFSDIKNIEELIELLKEATSETKYKFKHLGEEVRKLVDISDNEFINIPLVNIKLEGKLSSLNNVDGNRLLNLLYVDGEKGIENIYIMSLEFNKYLVDIYVNGDNLKIYVKNKGE